MSEREQRKRMKALLVGIDRRGRADGYGSEYLFCAIREGWVEVGSNGSFYLTTNGRRAISRY